LINKIVSSLRGLLELNRAVESLLVDIVASYAPWIAPIPVAMMSYDHMVRLLELPTIAALAGAVCIEFLGLSAVSTCVQFWTWNADATKTQKRAPFALAMGAGIFYLAVVVTLNAMLDDAPTVHRIAKGLIASLSAVAAVILAMRASHSRRVDNAQQERERRRLERQQTRIERQQATARPFSMASTSTPGNGSSHGGLMEVITQ
jgi:hypothetical protein